MKSMKGRRFWNGIAFRIVMIFFALLIPIYALLIISARAYIAALEKQALANSQYSSGIARVIDKVCTSVLIYGSQNRMRLIDDHAVSLVLDCEFN